MTVFPSAPNLIPREDDNDLNTIPGPSTPAGQAGGEKRGEESVALLYLRDYMTHE